MTSMCRRPCRPFATWMLSGVVWLFAVLVPQPGRAEDPTVFELPNGMTIAVIVDRRLPVVTHMVFYRVGSADEPRGKSGLAHLLEHLMFKATERTASGEFAKIISRIGGNDNAITTADTTYYYQRIAKRHLPRVMQLEADRMLGLKLDAKEIAVELNVVAEERRMRVESEPIGILSEQMLALLYLHHPYRVSGFGWPHELAALTKPDVEAFYRRHYAPSQAIAVIAGDVSVSEVRELAATIYAPLPRREAAPQLRPSDPPARAARRVHMQDARAGAPTFVRMYTAPSEASAVGNEAESVEVLARILGHGDTSRLADTLVQRSKRALVAAAAYAGNARDGGRLTLFAVPAPGTAAGDLEAELDAVIARLAADGPDEDEVRLARDGIAAKRVFDDDSQFDRAKRIGESLAHGLTLQHILDGGKRLQSVTRESVRRVAAKVLRPEASVTGWVVPETAGKRAPTP